MSKRSLLETPLPVDRVAARVVFSRRPADETNFRPRGARAPSRRECFKFATFETPPRPTGKRPKHYVDLSGRRVGRLTFMYFYGREKFGEAKNQPYWVVRCDCGFFELRTPGACRPFASDLSGVEWSCEPCRRKQRLFSGKR